MLRFHRLNLSASCVGVELNSSFLVPFKNRIGGKVVVEYFV